MELSRDVSMQYEVVVIGGGLSGVCAALASARHGTRTAIIQARPVFGGNASSEIRMHIVGAGCHNGKENMHESGILHEILLENKHRNPYQSFPVFDTVLWEKVRYQENLDMYLNTSCTEVKTENGKITELTCYQSSTEKTYHIKAQIFIDATGHATIGLKAGAHTMTGTESKYEYNEPSAPEVRNEYTSGNTIQYVAVDRGEPVKFVKPFWAYDLDEEYLKYREHGMNFFARSDGGHIINYAEGDKRDDLVLPQFSDWSAGHWWIELGGDYNDIVGNDEEIRDELLKYVFGVWDHIKNKGDHGAENYDLEWVGFVPGYRESRRLRGDYLLTENDIRANRVFDDAVAYGGWPMDEHTPGGISAPDKEPARTLMFPGAYSIPYRCYYSDNISNLMMAGRDISVTRTAYGSVRVMGTCAVGGQAVGTAASLACKYHCTPKEVGGHINELQQELMKDDCFIYGFRNRDENDLARNAKVSATSFKKGFEPENVINGMSRSWEEDSNMWQSESLESGKEALTLSLPKAQEIREIRVTFDTNLTREIMPSISRVNKARQVKGMPEELVKDYTVRLLLDGKEVFRREEKDNYQRLNVIHTAQDGILADTAEIEVHESYGCKEARVFEVRLY